MTYGEKNNSEVVSLIDRGDSPYILHCHGHNSNETVIYEKPPLQNLPVGTGPLPGHRELAAVFHIPPGEWGKMRKAQVGFDNGFKDMVEKELNTFSTTPQTHWASGIQSSYSENQSGSGRRKTFRPQRTTTACLGVGNHGDKLKHHHTHIFNLDAVHRYWPPKLNSGPCKAPVAP